MPSLAARMLAYRKREGEKMATYKNPCYTPGKPQYGPEYYETDAKPTKRGGYLIYHRIKSYAKGGGVWDVVLNGVCKTQMAGPSGARRWIDSRQGHA